MRPLRVGREFLEVVGEEGSVVAPDTERGSGPDAEAREAPKDEPPCGVGSAPLEKVDGRGSLLGPAAGACAYGERSSSCPAGTPPDSAPGSES